MKHYFPIAVVIAVLFCMAPCCKPDDVIHELPSPTPRGPEPERVP